jgi:hypothetical protein
VESTSLETLEPLLKLAFGSPIYCPNEKINKTNSYCALVFNYFTEVLLKLVTGSPIIKDMMVKCVAETN